jgi:hypothetical protein
MKLKINVMANKNLLAFAIISGFVLLTMPVFVSAEFWACFTNNGNIDFCNPQISDRICDHETCKFCMNNYDELNDCYGPGNFNLCNSQADQTCSTDGSTNIDSTPPIITLSSPQNNQIFTSRSLPLIFSLNEISDVYYLDLINGRGRWTRVCTDCISYSKSRRFNEGTNQILIRATDLTGNAAERQVNFTVDSKGPKIKKAEPKKGYTSGEFYVEFDESNPRVLTAHIGNFIEGFVASNISVENNCFQGRRYMECNFDLNVSQFDGQQISYWVELKDIAGNIGNSKSSTLDVDITNPVIESINYTIDDNYVYFDIKVNELNFEEISYIDNADLRARVTRLCSRLDANGMCSVRKSFREGFHALTINVVDEAGNSAIRDIEFTTT